MARLSDCKLLRRWRQECQSCNRRAGPFRNSSIPPVAACLAKKTVQRRSRTLSKNCYWIPLGRGPWGNQAATQCSKISAPKRWRERAWKFIATQLQDILDSRPSTLNPPKMAYEFKVVRRVEFSDTDMAGIVHYSNFFRYMETAEHGFFRSLGFSVVTRQVDPPVGWPRVHARCDYKQPLRFEDEVEIHMLVREKKSKSLTYLFRFRKLNAPEPLEVARGSLPVVC